MHDYVVCGDFFLFYHSGEGGDSSYASAFNIGIIVVAAISITGLLAALSAVYLLKCKDRGIQPSIHDLEGRRGETSKLNNSVFVADMDEGNVADRRKRKKKSGKRRGSRIRSQAMPR